jgi:hypothetical protein
MTDHKKQAQRQSRSKDYRQFLRTIVEVDRSRFSAASIFDCLSAARQNESYALSAMLLKREAFKEAPQDDAPSELSDPAISQYFSNAAHFYAAAAGQCMLISDLNRAFRYYRRAAKYCRQAAELETPGNATLLVESQEYAARAAVVRQQHARNSICRRRLSLGVLRRRR